MGTPSEPIFRDEPLEGRARAALDALSEALVRVDPSHLGEPTVASGHAGLALAHAYVAPHFPDRPHADAMQAMIAAAMDAVASAPSRPSLLGGFLGLAWVVQHLTGGDGDVDASDDADPNVEIDAQMAHWLDRTPWDQTYDLVGGLVGIGIYALERMPRASGRLLAEKVVDRLAEIAEEVPGGLAWRTRAEWLPEETRARRPASYVDLGLAHGQAGIVGILGAFVGAGVAVDRARPLLTGAVDWMLAQRLPEGEASRFPTWVAPGVPPSPSRDAWCYGDPGVAIALLQAARAAGDPAWEAAALDVALHAATRSIEASQCVDAGLCHGWFGTAQIFHRAYRMTGDARFKAATRAYAARGLDHRALDADAAFAGFRAYQVTEAGAPSWVGEPGFLTGGAGIALALTALLADEADDPAWDRLLLLSTPANVTSADDREGTRLDPAASRMAG